ncbi:MAG: leucine-rich repeat protein [Lachnospiraceae bacterium]|nr:leucine-rich repeat protein [Lachnospiraceae bacterium]
MEAYYSDGRGRYGTGESFDYFCKYEDCDDEPQIFTSSDGLWTYGFAEPNVPSDKIEILRYNGCETNITVPETLDGKSVVALDDTFNSFFELESVVVPEGVTDIVGAFYGCEGLKKVTLPQSLENMEYALNCCFSLEEINIPPKVEDFSHTFSGTGIKTFVFPQGTKTIYSSFFDSEAIQKVVIPGSVLDTTEAFSDCENLSEVTLEDGIEEIGDYTFFHCTSLLELTIPESVKTFGKFSVGYMEIREYTDSRKMAFRIKGKCIVPGFRIKGFQGSAAEQYAKENNIPFIAL